MNPSSFLFGQHRASLPDHLQIVIGLWLLHVILRSGCLRRLDWSKLSSLLFDRSGFRLFQAWSFKFMRFFFLYIVLRLLNLLLRDQHVTRGDLGLWLHINVLWLVRWWLDVLRLSVRDRLLVCNLLWWSFVFRDLVNRLLNWWVLGVLD